MNLRVLLVAAAVAVPVHGSAQTAACPQPLEVAQSHLLGLWHAQFEGLAQGATLLLEKHPQYPDGIAGGVNRDGTRGRVSGEIEDGEFVLEESADGKHITATWIGTVVEGSCGKEIRGTWQRDGDSRAVKFILKRSSSESR